MLDKSMWKTHDVLLTKKGKIFRDFSYGARDYPDIKCSIKVFRQPGFFYWNALLPFLLVSFASLAPFVNDIKTPHTRLPATCTLMLTSVSTRFTIGRLLPTVSYLTSLDKYSLGTMFIITMELLYHATMGAIFPKIPEDIGYKIDFCVFGLFCGLILMKQILLLIWILKVKHYRRKVHEHQVIKLNDEKKSAHTEDDENEEKFPSVLVNFNKIWKSNNKYGNYTDTRSINQEQQNEARFPLVN